MNDNKNSNNSNNEKPGVNEAVLAWLLCMVALTVICLTLWLLTMNAYAKGQGPQEPENVGVFVFADLDHSGRYTEGDIYLGGQLIELLELVCPTNDDSCVEGADIQSGYTDAQGDVSFTITRGNRYAVCYTQGNAGCILAPAGRLLTHFANMDYKQVFMPQVYAK